MHARRTVKRWRLEPMRKGQLLKTRRRAAIKPAGPAHAQDDPLAHKLLLRYMQEHFEWMSVTGYSVDIRTDSIHQHGPHSAAAVDHLGNLQLVAGAHFDQVNRGVQTDHLHQLKRRLRQVGLSDFRAQRHGDVEQAELFAWGLTLEGRLHCVGTPFLRCCAPSAAETACNCSGVHHS